MPFYFLEICKIWDVCPQCAIKAGIHPEISGSDAADILEKLSKGICIEHRDTNIKDFRFTDPLLN